MRAALVLCAGAAALCGATGLYCPGCGAGRACYSILHLRFADAFCYNLLMTIMLPLIGLYIAVRAVDWVITGGNHIDRKISAKALLGLLVLILIYGILRNIPVFPFTLLARGISRYSRLHCSLRAGLHRCSENKILNNGG